MVRVFLFIPFLPCFMSMIELHCANENFVLLKLDLVFSRMDFELNN